MEEGCFTSLRDLLASVIQLRNYAKYQGSDKISYYRTKRIDYKIVNVKDSVGCGIDEEQSRDLSDLAKQRENKSRKRCLDKLESEQKSHKYTERHGKEKI